MTPKREYYYSDKYLHTTIKKTLRTYYRNSSRSGVYSCTQSRCRQPNLLRICATYMKKHKIETRGARPLKKTLRIPWGRRGARPRSGRFFIGFLRIFWRASRAQKLTTSDDSFGLFSDLFFHSNQHFPVFWKFIYFPKNFFEIRVFQNSLMGISIT